jgi:phosphoglycerol transferase MdoB-like AlkP superfamily enzyme
MSERLPESSNGEKREFIASRFLNKIGGKALESASHEPTYQYAVPFHHHTLYFSSDAIEQARPGATHLSVRDPNTGERAYVRYSKAMVRYDDGFISFAKYLKKNGIPPYGI